jgi:tetratricopeptide (TPR) repeat protein
LRFVPVNLRIRIIACLALGALLPALAWLLWPSRGTAPRVDELEPQRQQLAVGDYSAAIHALLHRELPAGLEGQRHLLLATAYRPLRRLADWEAALAAAARDPELAAAVDVERQLAAATLGQFPGSPDTVYAQLERAGVAPTESAAAIAEGLLTTGRARDAGAFLQRLRSTAPDAAVSSYLAAMHALATGDSPRAEQQLLATIDRHPRYERAYIALVDVTAASDDPRAWSRSRIVLDDARLRFPFNGELIARSASWLRQTGDATAAAQALQDSTLSADWELADWELADWELAEALGDQGRYAAALQLLKDACGIDAPHMLQQLDAAFALAAAGRAEEGAPVLEQASVVATLLALAGDTPSALSLFDRLADRTARIRRIADLETQLSLYPNANTLQQQHQAAHDLNVPFSSAEPDTLTFLQQELPLDSGATPPLARGAALYMRLCAQCHGATGDGLGRAAVHLHPAPRSFLTEPMRYVSTRNRVASDEDLRQTILRGLSGVSMPGFPELSQPEVDALLQVVRGLQRIGLQRAYATAQQHATADPDAEQSASDIVADSVAEFQSISGGNSREAGSEQPTATRPLVTNPAATASRDAWIAARLHPDAPLPLPDLSALPDATALPEANMAGNVPDNVADKVAAEMAAGREVFVRTGCQLCHAVGGEPSPNRPRFLDAAGRTLVARQFGREPLRRGGQAEELPRRILLGMPGTPHPAAELPPEDLLPLIAYLQSIADVPAPELRNHARRF